jgi:hypothetical protein
MSNWWEPLGYESLEAYFASRMPSYGLAAMIAHSQGDPTDLRVIMAPPGTTGIEVPQELLAACKKAGRVICDQMAESYAISLLERGNAPIH